jgi:hypothetical protein
MKIVTPEFRVSYPSVFKAKKNELSGAEEFSLVALFPKGADLSQLEAAAKAVMEEKWGKDKSKWPKNIRSPFRKQDEKIKDGVLPAGHEAGAVFMNLKSKQRPQVVDQSVQPILSESDFYPGCWARASVRAYAYDNMGNRGVSFGLQNIQKVKEGDPLSSSKSFAADDFAPIAGAAASSTDDLFG